MLLKDNQKACLQRVSQRKAPKEALNGASQTASFLLEVGRAELEGKAVP